MASHLAKLAARSASLREAVFAKEAGLWGAGLKGIGEAAFRGVKGVGGWSVKHPLAAAGMGLVAAAAPTALRGQYQQSKAGFDPAMQQAMLGPTPGA